VKIVPAAVLGRGVISDAQAKETLAELLQREGYSAMDAVKTGKVVLLSEDLFRSEAGQTAAAVCMAKVMYPDLFEDTDANEAAAELLTESSGTAADGIYYYNTH
ncbi:MAG: hypothetical protein MJ175_10655, partial [Clostridia bacterium]|nr:hypothetical protein [Clostridia bacterium]